MQYTTLGPRPYQEPELELELELELERKFHDDHEYVHPTWI